MDASPSQRRYCGIDVGKSKHAACVLDAQGQVVLKSFFFNNDADGYERVRVRLAAAGGPAVVLVGMEATGHYWYGLHDFLVRQGFLVVVLNPLQTALQARKAIRKSQ